jgi:hypothetical protein
VRLELQRNSFGDFSDVRRDSVLEGCFRGPWRLSRSGISGCKEFLLFRNISWVWKDSAIQEYL